jgi:hypothetical protein
MDALLKRTKRFHILRFSDRTDSKIELLLRACTIDPASLRWVGRRPVVRASMTNVCQPLARGPLTVYVLNNVCRSANSKEVGGVSASISATGTTYTVLHEPDF